MKHYVTPSVDMQEFKRIDIIMASNPGDMFGQDNIDGTSNPWGGGL